MNDFEGISFFQQRRAVGCAGNDILIEFDHNPTRTDLKLLEQPGYAEPIRDFLLFSVDTNFHNQQKNRIRSNHLWVAREYGFKFVPDSLSQSMGSRDCDSHASLRRCYPDQVRRVTWLFQALSPPRADTPSM
jgi:hypothetical protein